MGRGVMTQSDAVATWFLFRDPDYDSAWEYFIDDLTTILQEVCPTLNPCNKWVDRESQQILENSHGRIVVSEYCDVVSVCLCVDNRQSNYEGLSEAWCGRVSKSIGKALGSLNADKLNHVGTMSNGESVYTRA